MMEIFCRLDIMFNKIKENVLKLNKSIKDYNVSIVCASKYFSVEEMRILYSLGITHFGESRADELLEKQQQLKDLNITWHFIGSLQSNKVRNVINQISYLHSLDRMSLVKAVQKYREKPLRCFIQLNLANESTKSGLKEDELLSFYPKLENYDKIKPIGLMQMGVYSDLELTKEIYKKTSKLNKQLNLKELSMGMTNDYIVALKYESTFIRIGSYFIK